MLLCNAHDDDLLELLRRHRERVEVYLQYDGTSAESSAHHRGRPAAAQGARPSSGVDPVDRLTHTGVLARLEGQTSGRVTWCDLTALPCSHPHCCSVGYLLR